MIIDATQSIAVIEKDGFLLSKWAPASIDFDSVRSACFFVLNRSGDLQHSPIRRFNRGCAANGSPIHERDVLSSTSNQLGQAKPSRPKRQLELHHYHGW